MTPQDREETRQMLSDNSTNNKPATLPIWRDVFRSRWNLLMFLALVLINVAMWRSSDDAGICASFLGLWLVFHRFIIAHKDRQPTSVPVILSGDAIVTCIGIATGEDGGGDCGVN